MRTSAGVSSQPLMCVTIANTNMFGNKCESDCISIGRELDPGPVTFFHGD